MDISEKIEKIKVHLKNCLIEAHRYHMCEDHSQGALYEIHAALARTELVILEASVGRINSPQGI